MRKDDVDYVIDRVSNAKCCAVVGLSNMGKSRLLRTLAVQPSVAQAADKDKLRFLFVYIDFNLMLDVSEQAFYEIILRSVLAELEQKSVSPQLVQDVTRAYEGVIHPVNSFAASLCFVEGMMALSTGLEVRLVLLYDEFDEPFEALDDRVFLNLRALKDRYPQAISYVVATCRRLRTIRQEHGAAEFAELFAHNVRFLHPLSQRDALLFLHELTGEDGTVLSQVQLDFVWDQAGGHLGLLESVRREIAQYPQENLQGMSEQHVLKRFRELLDDNLNIRTECAKLWNGLTELEQQALQRFLSGDPLDGQIADLDSLREKGVVVATSDGNARVFARLFEDFAHRRYLIRQKNVRGVRIDVNSGTVLVDGQPAPELTALEYKLLLLLYGNLNRTCDKYQIVEVVWSEEFLDEVDDARIEKLISRLRQKIEPDPSQPQYLLTVRGRGYKLVDPAG